MVAENEGWVAKAWEEPAPGRWEASEGFTQRNGATECPGERSSRPCGGDCRERVELQVNNE